MSVSIKQLPRISIVVPSYNQGRFLKDCFESIFRQDYPNLEVIVMDGGSTDDSVSIIRSYAPRLSYWQSQKDGGQSAAINEGMTHCTGELVAWLNSDDFYWKDSLWSVGRAWAEFPGHGIYLGNGMRFDHNTGAYTPFCNRHVAFNRNALVHGTDYLLQPSTFYLRDAWEKVGGLDPNLNFVMDWDLFIRIGRRYPAVVLQEFLAVSREYEETKTRSGKMKRGAEIVRMVQTHTRTEATPGSLLFLCETLLEVSQKDMPKELAHHLRGAQQVLARHVSTRYGGGHGFPERTDPQDKLYLPFARGADTPTTQSAAASAVPSISIVVPSGKSPSLLQQTLASIHCQGCDNVTAVLVDGDHSAYALNHGLAQAQGEIVGWLAPGDLMAAGALAEVTHAFAADPELDLVYGNALHIDFDGKLHLADHGPYLSGLWLGNPLTPDLGHSQGCDIDGPCAQPTVFFRRRLLERCGGLDESLRHVYAAELYARFAEHAKVQKLERVQAFCRARTGGQEEWNDRLIEVYRLQRARWPRFYAREFPAVLRSFVVSYLKRKFGGRLRKRVWLPAAALVGLAALLDIANPERWWHRRLHIRNQAAVPPPPLAPAAPKPLGEPPPASVVEVVEVVEVVAPAPEQEPAPAPEPRQAEFHALFCAASLPTNADGDQRVLQVLRCLHEISTIEFFCQRGTEHHTEATEGLIDAVHTAASIRLTQPYRIDHAPPWRSRIAAWLRHCGFRLGARYHHEVTKQLLPLYVNFRASIQVALERDVPDFLFVAAQTNPVALTLATKALDTRLILIAQDVEVDRVQATRRRDLEGEVRRARVFEADNLARFDGILVACANARQRLADEYGFPIDRIHVQSPEDDELNMWLRQLRTWPRRGANVARTLVAAA